MIQQFSGCFLKGLENITRKSWSYTNDNVVALKYFIWTRPDQTLSIFWIFDSLLLMSWYLNKIHLLRDCCAVLGNISSESPLPHSTVQHLPVSSVLLFQINQDIDWFVDTRGHCTPLGLQRKYKLVLLTRVLPDCLG